MFCWYLRYTYLENKLREPGGTTQLGVPVDLRSIDVPTFLYASEKDHIVPWKTAYNSTQVLAGDVTFVLGASGHIAGVINPPEKRKRNYWVQPASVDDTDDTETAAALPADPERWFETAEKVPGSWWPAWYEWLAGHAGTNVAARKKLGSAEYPPIEDAPGSYVKEKAS
jgi:polyhydroxyalkanoate synthase